MSAGPLLGLQRIENPLASPLVSASSNHHTILEKELPEHKSVWERRTLKARHFIAWLTNSPFRCCLSSQFIFSFAFHFFLFFLLGLFLFFQLVYLSLTLLAAAFFFFANSSSFAIPFFCCFACCRHASLFLRSFPFFLHSTG